MAAPLRRRSFYAMIDKMEGDVSSTDDDDLDAISYNRKKRAERNLLEDLEATPPSASASSFNSISGSASASASPSLPVRHIPEIVNAKVEWTDDSGDADLVPSKSENDKLPNPHKRRRLATAGNDRIPTSATSASRGRNVRNVQSGSVVGLKPARRHKPPLRRKGSSAEQRDFGAGTDHSSDEEAIEAALPDYLKQRRAGFENAKATLLEAGLALPPNYDDVDFSDDERLAQLQERPQLPGLKPSRLYEDVELGASGGVIPASVAQWLRQYQVEGTAFLHYLFVWQKGGILGDDMGLGKTIQVIAFLTVAFGKTGDERDFKRMRKMRRVPGNPWYPRILVVCPGSLMENWKTEFEKWGWWTVETYHGSTAEKESALLAAKTGRLEVMITTYTTYRLNRGQINMIEWDCVIADECHQIKEPTAEITKAMNEVNALCRIGLTGTAIQNKYEELWTLLNWTNPGRLGPLKSWKTVISEPLKIGQSHDATVPELAKARTTARMLARNLLPKFFLRRMKSLIADQLPKKTDRVVFCPLTEVQQEAYENFIASETVTAIRTSGDLCDCGSGKKRGWCHSAKLSDGSRWQTHVFSAMEAVRKLSNHVATLIPQSSDDRRQQERQLELLQIALPQQWRELYKTRDSIMHYANQSFCGKWRVLKKLLAFWHADDSGETANKVLVFSHSVRLLRMLQTLFNATTSYTVSYLDGSMSYADRARTVSLFNASPDQFVFLISTRAGGVGLNITSANKVVVVDPNWNPSYDLQAQDRAYRIGQARDVEVFRLVSAGTIEEIVYARQVYKQQQANIGYNASSERRYFKGVQDRKEQKGEIFGLKNIFAEVGDSVVLKEIVNKTNVAESRAGVMVAGLDRDSIGDEEGEDEEVNGVFDFEGAKGVRKGKKSRTRTGKSGDGDNTSDDDDKADLHDSGDANDSDSDPSAALSQLASLISQDQDRSEDPSKSAVTTNTKKRKAKPQAPSAISAILAHAGVSYTHENDQVIGSSRIEARLSRRAEETAYTGPERAGETVFVAGGSSQVVEEEDDDGRGRYRDHGNGGDDDNGFDDDDASNLAQGSSSSRKRKYRPPPDVRERQFCSMARQAGYDEGDITGFALLVESWTQRERRGFLESFYERGLG